MNSRFLSRARKTLGFRLTLWYAAIFIASSVMLFIVSYIFLSASVRDNRKDVQSKLKKYLTIAQRDGLAAVERAAGHRRNTFFVRILGPGNNTVYLSNPQLWDKFDVKPLHDQPA